ncbi:hypothetical protein SERLA73DRAFT_79492 [Serpula lacrymans var. lacrymans S7.3]|uniref:F-box domain-containing protein n=2 Tax=Serpula lacrymans var. lacrymans TaxID=341189 RepID=F8QGL6_SERL3|nr:uncharacterized protein SERLADRAFT_433309 [Serpula lacrymans var. lacrymans S7.9]EGN92562.1 hypothetical protein SERLA73DRAFT_79492 [Serpula lacrymans var. lacrymans S7.3]EGO29309.1 hypothetical protein SERLADRAFT_433309 [Serpula lacrymans var. lacrymans S7.9]
MKDLPVELLDAIAENTTSVADLLSLRGINVTCHELVTPKVFRKLHIRNSLKSVQNCQDILASLEIAPFVREVVYDYRDGSCNCLPLSPRSTDDSLDTFQIIAELEESLTEFFCQLSRFINLDAVTLNFWPAFITPSGLEVREHPFWFTNRQLAVLHAIYYSMKTSPIKSLTLNNIVLMSPKCYNFPSPLVETSFSHLSISVAANNELGEWSGSKSLNSSLSPLLPPSNPHLTSLVFRSPRGLYFSPTLRLASHYPALQSLVLENIVFDHNSPSENIEEFIIRHKDSLVRLELRSCSCYIINDSGTKGGRSWSGIWERLKQELTGLREIVVDRGSQGYTHLDPVLGHVPHKSFNHARAEQDEEKFQNFASAVRTRSNISVTCH